MMKTANQLEQISTTNPKIFTSRDPTYMEILWSINRTNTENMSVE